MPHIFLLSLPAVLIGDESTVKRKTFCLISVMQQTFLRYETTSTILDIDLSKKENRKAWHTQILHDILEVSE